MKYIKNQIYKTHYKSSTIPKGTMAELGTIEKDACSYFGMHDKKPFHGHDVMEKVIKHLKFKTVLDVGAGKCLQADYFKKKEKTVYTCDLDDINGAHCDINNSYDYLGNFLDIDFNNKKFDFVFASHILEHQRNVGCFIDKLVSVTNEDFFLCIIVPIRKPFVTGGHLTLWNPGLLLYNLVASGIDCQECYLEQSDYDIFLIVKLKKINLDNIPLTYDRGDVNLLSKYFPFKLEEPFNGDIMYYNSLFKE